MSVCPFVCVSVTNFQTNEAIKICHTGKNIWKKIDSRAIMYSLYIYLQITGCPQARPIFCFDDSESIQQIFLTIVILFSEDGN